MAAEAFLAALRPAIVAVAVVMTPDTAFGKDRAGTPASLAAAGVAAGFEVVVVDPELDDGPISSSRIRKALAAGEIATATRLLGRRPSFTGTVVRGDGRGRELGYPTANLAFNYLPALPALGIYAGLTGGRPALVSVGRRPTFHDDGEVVVEAHLLDWDGDLYDQELRVELAHRIRDEQRFASAHELTDQMRQDEADARRLLSADMTSSPF
jgi:riboflavin kinase/FMN adenylyltransferase